MNSVPVKPVTESLADTGYDGTAMLEYLKSKCGCVVIDAKKICEPFGSSRYFNIAILGVAVGTGRLGISKETILKEIENVYLQNLSKRIKRHFLQDTVRVKI